jgi:hypothetical protein
MFMGNARCFNKLELFIANVFIMYKVVMGCYSSTLTRYDPGSVPTTIALELVLGGHTASTMD